MLKEVQLVYLGKNQQQLLINMSNSAKTFKSNKAYGTKLYNSNIEPLDALYGPWDSLDEFIKTVAEDPNLVISDVLQDLTPGLTIAVINGDIIEEWWNPIAGKPFVKKQVENDIQDVTEQDIDGLFQEKDSELN